MSSATPATPEAQPPLSQTERVLDTFIAPTKAFTDLRRSANWIVPFLLMSIATIALVFVADRKIGLEKIVENQLAMQPKQAARLDQLSPEDRARKMQTVVSFNRTVSYMYPLFILVFLVIVAGVLLATFNFGLGTEVTFNQSLAVCIYASLPSVIKALLAVLVLFLGAGEAFTFQNPIASNLSGLFDPSSHFLYAVALNLDVFNIWTIALTGIGFSCLTKIKRSTCLGVLFVWWAVWVLGISGISAAFS